MLNSIFIFSKATNAFSSVTPPDPICTKKLSLTTTNYSFTIPTYSNLISLNPGVNNVSLTKLNGAPLVVTMGQVPVLVLYATSTNPSGQTTFYTVSATNNCTDFGYNRSRTIYLLANSTGTRLSVQFNYIDEFSSYTIYKKYTSLGVFNVTAFNAIGALLGWNVMQVQTVPTYTYGS